MAINLDRSLVKQFQQFDLIRRIAFYKPVLCKGCWCKMSGFLKLMWRQKESSFKINSCMKRRGKGADFPSTNFPSNSPVQVQIEMLEHHPISRDYFSSGSKLAIRSVPFGTTSRKPYFYGCQLVFLLCKDEKHPQIILPLPKMQPAWP